MILFAQEQEEPRQTSSSFRLPLLKRREDVRRILVCPVIVRRDENGRTKVVYECGPADKMKQLYEKIENPVGGCLVIIEKNEQGRPRVRSVCGPADRLEQLLSQL